MYLLVFVSGTEEVTSEKPVSLEYAQQAWQRWHKYTKCPLIKLRIDAVGDAPPFVPLDAAKLVVDMVT